jgi:hypothetical protein
MDYVVRYTGARSGTGRYEALNNRNQAVVGGPVQDMVVDSQGRLIIAGFFTSVGGVFAARIARRNVDGTWEPLGGGASEGIYAVAVTPSDTIIAHKIGSINELSEWSDAGGGSWTTITGFAPSVTVNAIATNLDGDIAVGLNTSFGGVYAAVWRRSTATWRTVTLNGPVYALVFYPRTSRRILMGGFFSTTLQQGPTLSNNAQFYDYDTQTLSSAMAKPSEPNASVRAIYVTSPSKILLAGNFTSVGGVDVTNGCRMIIWDGGTGFQGLIGTGAFTAGLTNAVVEDVASRTIYVGGVSGAFFRYWDGTDWVTHGGNVNSTVNALALLPRNSLIVGTTGAASQYRLGYGTTYAVQDVLNVGGNAAVEAIAGNLYGGLLDMTPAVRFSPTSFRIAERFAQWMQYATSRRWTDGLADGYDSANVSWWSRWQVDSTPSTRALQWQTLSSPSNGYGGVLLPDGWVLFAPQGTTATLFDYRTDSTVTVTAPSRVHRGAVLMPDGRALCIPYNTAAAVGVFDYRSRTFTTYAVPVTSTTGFWGGTLMPDGRVLMATRDRINIPGLLAFNPAINATESLLTTYGESAKGALMMPNGDILLPGRALGGSSLVYHPADGTVSEPSTPGGGVFPSASAILLPDGRAFLPRDSAFGSYKSHVYNARTNKITTLNDPNAVYTGGVLMPDGRALAVPNSGYAPLAFDYRDDSFVTFGATTAASFNGAVALPDGRVVMIPSSSNMGLVSFVSALANDPPLDLCYHPCFNKL